MSDLNIIIWLCQRPCVQRDGMRTYVCVPSRFSYHIHYVNLDLRCHFLIDGYVIFLSLHRTISYLRTMSAYGLCISVSSSVVFMLYPVIYLPVPTLDLSLPHSVSTLDYIYFLFDITLNISNMLLG